MKKNIATRVAGLIVCLLPWSASSLASTISFVGDLRADANVTSCGPSCTLNATSSDGDYAQYAAVVESFSLSSSATVSAVSLSYGGGVNAAGMTIAQSGLEPYLSLFDSAGTFLASTYFGTTCPAGANTNTALGYCYDVLLNAGTLAAGTYQIALSAYENMSFAENHGMGTLADGFTGLGNLGNGEDLHYAFDVTLAPAAPTLVPEPLPVGLVGISGLLGVAANLIRRHPRKSSGTTS